MSTKEPPKPEDARAAASVPDAQPDSLEPTEGGIDESSGAFGGGPFRAFNFATSAANASTSSINC